MVVVLRTEDFTFMFKQSVISIHQWYEKVRKFQHNRDGICCYHGNSQYEAGREQELLQRKKKQTYITLSSMHRNECCAVLSVQFSAVVWLHDQNSFLTSLVGKRNEQLSHACESSESWPKETWENSLILMRLEIFSVLHKRGLYLQFYLSSGWIIEQVFKPTQKNNRIERWVRGAEDTKGE